MHSKSAIFLILFAITMLTACQSIPPCGGADKRAWKLLSDPPENSTTLRALANDAYPISQGWTNVNEKWFRLGTKQVMLCRGRFHPYEMTYGHWWQFTLENEQYAITEQMGWVYIN